MAVVETVLALAGIVVFLFLVVAIVQYNRLVTLRNRIRESWSNVGTELQRRHDLIPNLVETVKGYAKHEATLFAAIARDRSAAMTAAKQGAAAATRTEQAVAAGLGRLLAVAEAYPKLQASQNFLALQQELANTEDRIQAARRFYNGNVRDYKNQGGTFPGSLWRRSFPPEAESFFEAEATAATLPKVQLGAA